jgi:hypothetical protein
MSIMIVQRLFDNVANVAWILIAILVMGCQMKSEVTSEPMRQYPPADDQMNLYNARPGIGQDVWATFYPDQAGKDPYTYINTVPEPEEVYEDEDVKSDAARLLRGYLESIGFPLVNDYGESLLDERAFAYRGEVNGFFEAIDRTMETPVSDPAMFTTEYIRHIQTTLLKKHPLWRLRIVGTWREGESSIMVYPDAVCVGDKCCPPCDLDEQLALWRRTTMDMRDKKNGRRLRQLRVARQFLKTRFSQIESAPVVIVAAFDNCHGDPSKHSFWVLYRPGKIEYDLYSHRSIGGGTSLRISETGDVVSVYEKKRSKYRMIEHAIPADGPHELVFRKHRNQPSPLESIVLEDEPEFRITLTDLLSEEETRRLLQAGAK